MFILLMFQALRLTEFVLIHGVQAQTILQIITYLSVSFLPAILPMSLLLAILLAYSRMSNDSEIVAFKAIGLHSGHLASPAIILSTLIFALSAHTAFNVAPWGNRQFEILVEKIGSTKATASIKEGTFSEGFFDLIVYANKINTKNNHLKEIFIYDDRDNTPLTIIAQEGQILKKSKNSNRTLLRLKNGDIHRQNENHTKIHFETYDIQLFKPQKNSYKEKTPPSLTYKDLQEGLISPKTSKEQRIILQTEFHKRWAVAFACIVFGLLGVSLGIKTNRRSGKSGGMVLAIGVIVIYWILYLSFENLGRNGWLPIPIAIWLPNALFSLYAIKSFQQRT